MIDRQLDGWSGKTSVHERGALFDLHLILPEQVHTARYAGSANGRSTRCISGTTALTLRDGKSGFIVT